jgi:hypothetical protein
MPTTKTRLTLAEVKKRVEEILSKRTVSNGRSRWDDPEAVNGLIDDLRKDVVRAIARGSKVPYALARAIVDLPYAHYGSEPHPKAE